MYRTAISPIRASAPLRLDLGKALAEEPLRFERGDGVDREHVSRDAARLAEEFLRFGRREAGKNSRLEIGCDRIGLFDLVLELAGGVRRQAEAQMHSRFQPLLDGLVPTADDRLEGGDHVADHIFGRVVQQRHQAIGGCGFIEMPENGFDDKAVLRHGKGVITCRLAVPAGDACKSVGDIAQFDVERRGV